MKTITFNVSKTKEIETNFFIYGIVIEDEKVKGQLKLIDEVKTDSYLFLVPK